MLEKAVCALCGREEASVLIRERTGNSIVQCPGCHFVYRYPEEDEAAVLERVTADGVPVEHEKKVWLNAKLGLFRKNLLFLQRLQPFKGRLLDVGSGYGIFLDMARQSGWRVQGVEISRSAVDHARKLGLEVSGVTLRQTNFPEASFDAVTMWDLAGLFRDPMREFKEAFRILKPGGMIALRTHNARFNVCIARLLQKVGWLKSLLRIKPTIFHSSNFSPDSIRGALAETGFADIRVRVSEATRGDPYSTGGLLGKYGVTAVKSVLFYSCSALYYVSGGRIVTGPSMLVFARKPLTVKKPGIIHIITRLDAGGSAENTLQTVAHLHEGLNVKLISGSAIDPGSRIAEFFSKNSIAYLRVADLRRSINLIRDIKAFFRIYAVLKSEKPEIVHTHTSKAGILGRWAAKMAGVPHIVHTPHGHVFYGYFNKFLSGIFVLLERLTATITERIIPLTEVGRQEHIRYRIGSPDKFVPIYSGIDLETIQGQPCDRQKIKDELGLAAGSFVVGMVSRLEPVKGIGFFIRAVPEIIQKFPSLTVVIVGDGSQRHGLERLVSELGLEGRVRFMGARSAAVTLIPVFDLFIQPSLMEGMGKSLLEAQALGVPVVATTVGGIPEVVENGKTGLLVPPKDPDALAQAVISLLSDNGRRSAMSGHCREWVTERFSQAAMIKKLEELYGSLLSPKT